MGTHRIKKRFSTTPLILERESVLKLKRYNYFSNTLFWLIIILLTVNLNLYSQNGPGGIGKKDGTTTLKTWYQANSGIVHDASNKVSGWNNSVSIPQMNLSAAGTLRPDYQVNVLNGMPVVSFLATNSLSTSSFLDPSYFPTNASSVFIVSSDDDVTQNSYIYSTSPLVPNNRFAANLPYGGNYYFFFGDNLATGYLTGAYNSNAYQFYIWNGNGNPANGKTVYKNESLLNSSAGVGTFTNHLSSNFKLNYGSFKGDIAELIIYTDYINSAQRKIVDNYLSAKYNISIAASGNDKYASNDAAYTFDVVGIGAEADGKNSSATTAGVYLSENSGSLGVGDYLMAGYANLVDSITTNDVPLSVTHRWNKIWYFEKTGTVDAKISFDFSEGINGGKPGAISNYVLLYRASTIGNFSIVAGVSAAIENVDQIYFNVPNANLTSGYYTLGTQNAPNSPLDGCKTWYNYYVDNSDNWDNWQRWTLDPDGSLLINPYKVTPGASDTVVILTGTMNISSSNKSAAVMDIRSGGVLNVASTTSGHNFTIITGNGRIILNNDNYPTGDDSIFRSQGTVEFGGGSYNLAALNTAKSFYNLIINLDVSTNTVVLKSNISILNSFVIQQGKFQINDNTNNIKYTINVTGNVSVEANGQIATGTGNPFLAAAYSYATSTLPASGLYHSIYHELNIGGDFTNFGTVRFTNLTYPIYNEFATNGGVTVKFNGSGNNTVNLYGPAYFYNFVIDKGNSQTYITTVYSANSAYFNLYGGNALGRNETAPFSASNPEIRKALFIKNGTLKLTGNIYIHSLSEGNMVSGNGDYAIGANASLWVAGSNVTVYSTANTTAQAPAGTTWVQTGMSNQALSVYGKFQISGGLFGTHNSAGLIFWSDYAGIVQIDGGTVNVSQFRSASGAAGKSTYIQTGGILTVRGDKTEAGEIDNGYPLFGLVNTNDNFLVSGGTINLYDIAGGTGYGNNSFYVNSASGNYDVTGGTVNVQVDGGVNFDMYSTSNLWNLNVQSYNGAASAYARLNGNLAISNDLFIYDNSRFDPSTNGGATNYNVNIGRNLTIGSTSGSTTAQFVPRNNTTTFDSDLNSTITVSSNNTTYYFSPYDFTINKNASANKVTMAYRPGTAAALIANIRNNFTVTNGTFDYATYNIDVQGNLNNNGVMGVWNRIGRIRLNNTGAIQTITGAVGSSILFGHIEVAHTDGSANNVQLNSNASLDLLTLTSGRIYLQNNKLSVDTNFVYGAATCGVNRMIETMADNGNRGLQLKMTYNYNVATTVTFPVGTFDGTNHLWNKVDVGLTNTVGNETGYLNVAPVPLEHPTKVSGGCDALIGYWKVIKTGLTTAIGGVSYAFTSSFDFPAGGGYKRFYLLNGIWTSDGNATLPGVNTLAAATLNGFKTLDFTAAKNACFNNVNNVYSNGTGGGAWNVGASWLGGVVPQTFDIAVIRSGDIITASSGANDASTVTINSGGTLDVGIVTGLSYGIVQGGGKFRIASNTAATAPTLPTADFDPFLLNDTATFEYSGTASYPLISSINYYPNLKIGGSASTVKTLPTFATAATLTVNKDLLIYDDTNNGVVLALNNSATSGYDLAVKGSVKFDNLGVLRFPATGAIKTVTIEKSIDFTTNTNTDANRVEIEDAAGTWSNFHNLIVKENIVMNDGSFLTLYRNKTTRRAVNLYFRGGATSQISTSTSPNIKLNYLFVEKDLLANTVSFNSDFDLTDNTDRPITLTKGSLILNNTGIDISLTSGDGNFTIPISGQLTVTNGIIRVSGNGNGIILNNRLQLQNSSQLLMSNSGEDNYIQYSNSASSELSIENTSTLTLGGQIRRSTVSESGTLIYNQTGGTVTVGDQSSGDASRGMLEVLNLGSNFTYTGGNLIIARGQSTTAAALYLSPTTSSLSGTSKITFGNANTPASQIIGIYSSISLKNIELSNLGAAKTVKVYSLPLTIDTLINAGQTFDANNLNITLKGNFRNSGTYTPGTNTTSFTGSQQKIVGTAIFKNLTINTTDSVRLYNDITVNGDLTISSGRFSDRAYTINLKGNIVNNGVHYSQSNSLGGIIFNGTSRQSMSGVGTYGRMNINNLSGVELQNDFYLTDRNLTLTAGSFYINQYLLDLGQQASIVTSSGAFSKDRMIVSNGAISDKGIKRALPSGSPANFTIPIGVFGIYTPVLVSSLTLSGSGYINVRPVNIVHPTVIDPDNALQYYWNLQTSGFTSFKGALGFSYDQSDVKVNGTNSESDYIPAYLNGVIWAKFGPENIDTYNNSIGFNFQTSENLSGDFTAGINAALPDNVPVFYSTKAGNWEDKTVWLREDLQPVTSYPNGYIVKINHTVTITTDLKSAYKTILAQKGKLIVGNTVGHYLGAVSGKGWISMINGRLPAGNYDDFFNCTGGTIEYGGTASYDLPNVGNTYRRLIFSGSGIRNLALKDITICDSLWINGPTSPSVLLVDNSRYNNKITLNGLFLKQGSGSTFKSSSTSGNYNAILVFNGITAQNLVGDFTGTSELNNFTMNNATGLTLGGNVSMKGTLTLTSGKITTGANTFNMTVASTVTPVGGNSTSFINGPLYKVLANGSNFTFPVGKSTRNGKFSVTNTSTASELTWKIEYFNTGNSNRTNLGANIAAVSDEYWRVTPPTGTSPVTLRWDESSDINGISAGGVANIRAVRYNTGTSLWEDQTATPTGTLTNGTITTNSAMSFTSAVSSDFALASFVPVIPSANFITTDTAICAGVSFKLRVNLTLGTNWTNWTLVYNDGSDHTVYPTGSPYEITVSPSSTTTYRLVSIQKDLALPVTAGTVSPNTVTVTVNPLPITSISVLESSGSLSDDGIICWSDNATLTASGGSTYSWSPSTGLSATNIANPVATPSITTTYTVTVTTAQGCVATANQMITVHALPTAVIDPLSSICDGDPILVTVNLTGMLPYNFDFDITRNNYPPIPPVSTIFSPRSFGSNTYTSAADYPLWVDNGSGNISNDYTYTVINLKDLSSGCFGSSVFKTITVYKKPVTGPEYHIPNDFGL